MILCADATRLPLPDKSVDLVLGSPPYMDARTYGIGADRKCQEWIDWMMVVTREALRVSRGLVLWVVGGNTRDRCYQPGCEGLLYECWRAGINCFTPAYYHRVSAFGAGGDQWLRPDIESCLAFSYEGKLPWADNKINGSPPKFRPGGAPTKRNKDGTRCNANVTKRNKDGTRKQEVYVAPDLCNPGNVISLSVGGGQIGSPLAHGSEAPYPERLAEFWIVGWCQPGGTVLDPFSGSGTTAAVAVANGRKYIASDIRLSQCELTARRLATVTPLHIYGA